MFTLDTFIQIDLTAFKQGQMSLLWTFTPTSQLATCLESTKFPVGTFNSRDFNSPGAPNPGNEFDLRLLTIFSHIIRFQSPCPYIDQTLLS